MSFNITRFIKNTSIIKCCKAVVAGFTLSVFALQANAQYCLPLYSNGCNGLNDLNSVTLAGQGASTINDPLTGCGPLNGYEDKTAVIPAVNLMQGGTYSGTVSTNNFGGEFYKIWIDFDNNNTFDPSEALTGNIGPFGNAVASNFSITIPITVPIGIHRMRIRLVMSPLGAIDPCTIESFGETHDYLVNILQAPACAGVPVITSLTPAGPINTCSGSVQTLNLSVPIASGYFIQWQQSINAGANWTNVGTNSTTYTFNVSGSAWYRVIVTCTNSTQSTTSGTVILNATPIIYAAVPYFHDFETWQTFCSNSDVPSGTSVNWTNNPPTGDESWRRDDQGATANWSNGFGNYIPPSKSGLHSARFSSSSATSGLPGNLDLYLDCSAQTGNKAVYFYHINDPGFGGGDSLLVYLSTNGGANFAQIGRFDTTTLWTRHTLPIVSNAAQTVIRFQGINPNFDFTDIGLDSVYVAAPCTGAPVSGTITPAGPLTGCTGSSFNLTTVGTTIAGNLNYQWQQSLNNLSWVNVPGANNIAFATPALFDTMYYRLVVTCAGSSISATSPSVTINIASPIYAGLPYSQGFETWINKCDVSDVPTVNWLNNPTTGDNSWRRDDQGITANWIAPTSGAYAPVSIEGSHSARFHTFFANFGSTGDLSLFVDCTIPGNKELQFQYINPSGSDTLEIWLSTNGGGSFTRLQSFDVATNWTLHTVPIISNSAQTIIRFRAISDFSDDLGIDDAKVLLPCVGTPVAGIVDSLTPCSGQAFILGATGTTLAAGITYQWQESVNGTTWTNSAGGNSSKLTATITAPMWYRLIVNCINSTLSDTSAPRLLQLASFYYCYCKSAASFTNDDDIGNFTVRKYPGNSILINNGIAAPLVNNPNADKVYTDYTSVGNITLYKDSIYRFFVTQINQQAFFPSAVAIFLDMNRDAVFDPVKERIFQKTTAAGSQQVSDTFRIPDTAQNGITGLRIVLVEGPFSFPDPCLVYNFGETEDYLAFIEYPPCDGATNAGTTLITDTLLCPGFPFTLTDTTHEKKRSGLSWLWQSSPDNQNWTDIPGSNGLDVLPQTSAAITTYYRLKMDCSFTSSSTYSTVVHVTAKPPYQCYCQSYADGGPNDLSDIGAIAVGNFIINGGGPHLNNPVAVKPYSNPAGFNNVLTLYTDSIYNLAAYHIIKSGTHQDAKVTMFIDYNNNFIYDIPAERVWTGFTTASNVFITSTFQVPSNAVTDVLTGMRFIINDNTSPNIPSDEACGTYTSGETEDYAVKIKLKASLGIHSTDQLSTFTIFPNPTNGRFTIKLSSSRAYNTLKLRITTVTGQQVYYKEYLSNSKEFAAEIGLEGKASGVYLVELSGDGEKAIKKLMVR